MSKINSSVDFMSCLNSTSFVLLSFKLFFFLIFSALLRGQSKVACAVIVP